MKTLLFAVLFASVSFGAGGLPPEACQHGQSSNVKIINSLEHVDVCRKNMFLTLETTVLNQGTEGIEIDRSRLSTLESFVALIDTTEMKSRAEAFSSVGDAMGEPPPPKFIKIAPGEFFSTASKILLTGPFFAKDGYYRMNVATSVPYRSGEKISSSSDIIFNLDSCD